MKSAAGSAGGGGGGGGAAGDAEALEARVAAFRADPQLMEVASRFVAEVLERAKEEASRRLRERDGAAPQVAGAGCAAGLRAGDPARRTSWCASSPRSASATLAGAAGAGRPPPSLPPPPPPPRAPRAPRAPTAPRRPYRPRKHRSSPLVAPFLSLFLSRRRRRRHHPVSTTFQPTPSG